MDGRKAWGFPAVGTSWWTERGPVLPEGASPFTRSSLGEVPHSRLKAKAGICYLVISKDRTDFLCCSDEDVKLRLGFEKNVLRVRSLPRLNLP